MRITRLRVRDIRRYRDLDVDLAPGLTVVRGPNEAGKSTIQRILELGLTRKVTSTAADLDELRPWDADERSRPFIGLEFIVEDGDVVRSGSLEKHFRGPKGTVALRVDGEVITDPALAEERLGSLTGVPTEAFFRSTASVRHHEVDGLARDEAALHDRLQMTISGADAGTSAAKKVLEKGMRDLTARGEKNPGRLKTAENQVEALRLTVEHGEAQLRQLEADRQALGIARDRRAATEALLAQRRSLLEKARQVERLQAERTVATDRYERYRDAARMKEELDVLHATHPSGTAFPILKAAVERMRSLSERVAYLRSALDGEVEIEFELPAEPRWKPVAAVAGVAAALAAVLAAVGLAGPGAGFVADGTLPLVLAGAVAVVAVVLGLVARWLFGGHRFDIQMRDDEIDRRLRGRSQMVLDLERSEGELAGLLGQAQVPDLATAETLLEAETAHVAEIERHVATLAGLVGDEPPELLAERRKEAALAVERLTAALDELGPIAREARARERLEVEVAEAETALGSERDDEANARARLEANPVDAEQVALAAERLATWSEQLAALQRRARVLDATLAGIERAERATMETATKFLERQMVGDLERVTNGRYRRVRIDETTLDISVWAPERGDWVDAHTLSQGTLDVVYLVARLGLVRLVTGDRRPPLVFDDPFVTFDDERASRTMALLKSLTRDFQVIYLTMSSRYDDVADAVIELPAPLAHDGSAEDRLHHLATAEPRRRLGLGRR